MHYNDQKKKEWRYSQIFASSIPKCPQRLIAIESHEILLRNDIFCRVYFQKRVQDRVDNTINLAIRNRRENYFQNLETPKSIGHYNNISIKYSESNRTLESE